MRSNPINSRTLHGHRLYLSCLQPLRQAQQFRRRRPEAGDFSTAPIQGRSAYPVPLTAQIDARYVAANDGQTLKLSSLVFRSCNIISSWHLSLPFSAPPPRLAFSGFWPRGELCKPHQCSIAFLEPCSTSGRRTNVDRVVAAVVLFRTILLTSPKVTDYSIQRQQVAGLNSDLTIARQLMSRVLLRSVCPVRFRWLAEFGPTTPTMGSAGFGGLDGNTHRHDSGVSTASV